MYSYFERNSKS